MLEGEIGIGGRCPQNVRNQPRSVTCADNSIMILTFDVLEMIVKNYFVLVGTQ